MSLEKLLKELEYAYQAISNSDFSTIDDKEQRFCNPLDVRISKYEAEVGYDEKMEAKIRDMENGRKKSTDEEQYIFELESAHGFEVNLSTVDEFDSTECDWLSPLSGNFVTIWKYVNDMQELKSLTIESLECFDTLIKRGEIERIPLLIDYMKELLNRECSSIFIYEKSGIESEFILEILDSIYKSIDLEYQFITKSDDKEILGELSEEIIYQYAMNPELIYEMSPRLFEELISKILRKFKMHTNLTKQTRDGGYDIVAIEDNQFLQNKYLIECKRYKPTKKVDVAVVQRLYGVKNDERATKAFLVTSSFFTKDAVKFAKKHAWDIELKDFHDIVKWLKYLVK